MRQFMWVLSTAVTFGQATTPSLRGVLQDLSGTLVPGAFVT